MSGRHPKRKYERVRDHFLAGRTLIRPEAERPPICDHTLSTTVCELERRYGVEFRRTPETRPGYQGVRTRWVRYSLPKTARDAVREKMRGAV